MKTLIFSIIAAICLSFTTWHHNLDEAKQLAQRDHRFILLNFSGSDWCGPCIRMHKEIFDEEVFRRFSDSTLILVNADFPRMKKNQLSKEQQKINDQIADKYNPQGKFPYTLLLNAEGKVLKDWDGYSGTKPEAFCAEVQSIINPNP